VPVFRIRRVPDDIAHSNAEVVRQVQQILREQFPRLHPDYVDGLPAKLRANAGRFQYFLNVAQNQRGTVRGFALTSWEPKLRLAYLDFLSVAWKRSGSGVGGALYEHVRGEAQARGAIGLFFECLPDDPALSPRPEIRRLNAARLRFYEQYGARPLDNNAYATPTPPEDDDPPYLVFDDLDSGRSLRRDEARAIVRAILEEKYAHLCAAAAVDRVAASFVDDPVAVRSPRYVKSPVRKAPLRYTLDRFRRIALVVNERHEIHHVRERGYVESPVRVRSILADLETLDILSRFPAREHGVEPILAVHDREMLSYFQRACATMKPGRSLYPYVFPIRNSARPPRELAMRAGYYCIDTFTPININAYSAARSAVDATLTAAGRLLEGHRIAYALVRPPGHHAEQRAFGGFCYLNNAAIAAQMLSAYGRVAVLDVDYHHGNGQQQIFLARDDVLTVSIHGHPSFAYPYFSGFAEERGEGPGAGFNLNLPLPEQADGVRHGRALGRALNRVREHDPIFLVVCLGLDTARGDPTGTWSLRAADFAAMGRRIGGLRLPTLVAQEGGYRTRSIGVNVRAFLAGLWDGWFGPS
jgi:acetoin utilization deacetylase AcuC-like enzyme/GNAT superfamily N-acetyltransferase